VSFRSTLFAQKVSRPEVPKWVLTTAWLIRNRGIERTQKLFSQVPHKLAEIDWQGLHDETLCWPQDVLSQFDVQVVGLMTKLWNVFCCRALMVIVFSYHGMEGCKQRGKVKPECCLLALAWLNWFRKITYLYENIHNLCFIIENVNHYFTKRFVLLL